jgi:PAS domain S-box-containing protein
LNIRRLSLIYIDVPALRPGTFGAYAIAVMLALGALVLRLAIDPYVEGAQYVVFISIVMISTLISGFGAGLVCAAVSLAGVYFIILPPRLSYHLDRPGDVIGLLLFIPALFIEVAVAAGMRLAVGRYRELSRDLEHRVEDRTAQVVQRSRELDEKNRELHEANEQFAAIYQHGMYMARLDLEGRVFNVSRAPLEDCGYTRADVIGKRFWECGWWNRSPEVQQRIRDGIEQALAGKPIREESSYFWADGTEHVVDVSIVPIRDSVGSVGFLSAQGLDITERARQYQATFENAAVGIAHFSNDLEWVRVNGALCRIVGYAACELVSKPVLDLIHPDYREAVLAAIERIREGKIDSTDAERRYLRKDGATVWVRTAVIAVRRSDGLIDHFVAVVQDISKRKSAEEELAKSEERFRTSILHSPIPTILFDDREQVLAVSKSWLTAAGGVCADNFHRMEDWANYFYGERSEEALELVREIIAAEPEDRKDELILTIGGEKRIWIFVTSGLGAGLDGRRLFVGQAQDVTESRAHEEQIQLLMRESHHRIKNILGLVQAVARQTAARDPEHFVARFAERIQALAANHDLLIDCQWHGADVEDLVRVQLAHFEDLVGSRIAIHGPKLRLNAAAAQAVGLAVHELATNASKYGALSTDGGRVDVDWRSDARSFEISWTERGGPPVRPPDRRGFGSTVIEQMAKRTVGGEVEADYAPSGFGWHLTCPAANALEETADIHER